jgi:phage terminase large subunit-like protein
MKNPDWSTPKNKWPQWAKDTEPRGDEEFFVDEEAAERAVNWFPRYLSHVEGFDGPFELQPWQADRIIKPLFGWKSRDGLRRYRKVFVFLPRKNGKSTLVSGLLMYLTIADGEKGARTYCAAPDGDTAAVVFDTARGMVEQNSVLAKRMNTFRRVMHYPKTRSRMEVLTSAPKTKFGRNIHGVCVDEYFAHPNSDLFDALHTGTAGRKQPVTFVVSTAGNDTQSACYKEYEYAVKLRDGIAIDDRYLPVIFEAERDDDWKDPETWRKANPNLDVIIPLAYLKSECLRAQQSPAYENTFRMLHLNQWVQQSDRFIPMDAWNACDTEVDPEALEGRLCYGGLDLSSTTDITALVLVFPPEEEDEPYKVLPFFWVPEDAVKSRPNSNYDFTTWVKRGLIYTTPGNVIDYRYILNTIHELSQKYNLAEIAYDRWGTQPIVNELTDEGYEVAQFGQGYASMNPPTKELLNIIYEKRIAHGNNDALTWQADNLAVKTDPAGNVKPDKAKSSEKIDGIVALIMALDRAIANEGSTIYDKEGFRFL